MERQKRVFLKTESIREEQDNSFKKQFVLPANNIEFL